MKKRVPPLILLCVFAFLLSACTPQKNINLSEYQEYYKKSVENSMNADIYYFQENRLNGQETKIREANVYALKDDDGNVVKSDDGSYQNHFIYATDKSDGTEYYAGASPSSSVKDKTQECCLKKVMDGENMIRTCQLMTASEFYHSEEFKPYRMESLIGELQELSFDDMDFTTDKAKFEEKLRLRSIAFAVKPEYLENYLAEHGENSLFAGSEYIEIEMAYERITQIVIYQEQEIERFQTSREAYNLKIAYYGPIIHMPSYDEQEKEQDIWRKI